MLPAMDLITTGPLHISTSDRALHVWVKDRCVRLWLDGRRPFITTDKE